MSKVSSWIQRQKKADLIDIADSIGFTDYEGLLKVELDVALQEYLEENASRLSSEPRLAPFYTRRGVGSPIKRESSSALDNGESTAIKRSAGRPLRRVVRSATEETSNAIESASSLGDSQEDQDSSEPDMIPARTRSATAMTRTPARNQVSMLQNASQIPLPPSPAVVASNIERQTALISNKVSAAIQDSGIIEASERTRQALSTVTSVHLAILAVEFWGLRQEVLPDKYFFTIPAIDFLKTQPVPVKVPDLFLLLDSSFWNPSLLWLTTTLFVPLAFSYFFNLSLNNSAKYKSGKTMGRPVFDPTSYSFDPLTFNVVKALMIYAILGRGNTFGGWIDLVNIDRVNSALKGGWWGALVGCGIGGLVTLYEAMLRN